MNTLNYYVYYKADPARVEELRALVEALFREVEAATGIRGQWQRRRDDPSTFMEIYLDVPLSCEFRATLEKAVRSVEFSRLVSERIVEVFQCA